MFRLFKSSKIAPAPPAPPRLEIHVSTRDQDIWNKFAEEVEATNEHIDYTNPGPLAYELAELCERRGAEELDAEKIMYFSEATNYLLELKKDGERIGFLLLDCYPSEYSQAKIWLVCVVSTEKGKGYSQMLIDHAIKIAQAAGKKNIHLEAISRTVGRKVYKPMGFDFNSSDGEEMSAQIGGTKENANNNDELSELNANVRNVNTNLLLEQVLANARGKNKLTNKLSNIPLKSGQMPLPNLPKQKVFGKLPPGIPGTRKNKRRNRRKSRNTRR